MNRKTTLHYAFFVLSLTYAWVMISTQVPTGFSSMTGLLLPQLTPEPPKWVTITAAEVESGATIPRNTNVIFHVPSTVQRIYRRVLLGETTGRTVRYWGYCFPEDYDPSTLRAGTLPGKVFLSEAERRWRAQRERLQLPLYSIYRPPSAQEQETIRRLPTIRHQMEVFGPAGARTCFIMTQEALAIGTDHDNDSLNTQRERQYKTDPFKLDSDGDGLEDGQEVLTLKTNPLVRDTDSDGIIDGIEDRNRNGLVDPGETDPTHWDSDGDTLCDGYCRVSGTKRLCNDNIGHQCVDLPYARWMGEDKNLNGVVDTGESDPLKLDTDGDKILDDQEYYNCLLARRTDC